MKNRVALILVFGMAVGCTPSRYAGRLDRVAGEASLLAAAYGARADQLAPGSPVLRTALTRAQELCRSVVTMRSTTPAPPERMQLGVLEGQLAEARALVARAEERERGRAKAAAALEERLGRASGSSEQRLRKLKKAVREANTEDALDQAMADADRVLRADRQEGDAKIADATRHGKLKAVVDAELAKVTVLLEAEKKRKESSSRVRHLERANAALLKAKGLVAPTATPSAELLDAAENAVAEAQDAVAKAEADAVVYPSPWFRVHAGVVTLSPYRLVKTEDGRGAFVLKETSGNADGYLEFDFHGREAWLDPQDSLERDPDYGLRFFPDWLVPDDYEARLRVTNSGAVNSQSSAVGGDITVETLVGWNVVGIGRRLPEETVQDPSLKKRPQGTLNLELGSGFVTDRDALVVHGHVEGGIGTVWAFPTKIDANTFRTATLYTGLYYGVFDFPQLDVDDRQYITRPRQAYNHLGALAARVDAAIPVSNSVDFVLGVRYQDPLGRSDLPESWSVFVGISVGLGGIFATSN